MDGLKPILRQDVRVAGPTTYAVTVSRALAAEQDQRDINIERQGNIFIKRVSTKALINSGATHSFISESFASHLDVKSIGLDVNYSVTVPSGEELSATCVIIDIDLELHGHIVYADLIVLPIPEFDIILGMDWLTKNRVLIDFQKRSVLAWRLISKGCQAFLASIVSTPHIPTPSISDVPVVRDFPDIFSDDVTVLPPERKAVDGA
ncbi:uncharacterized protein [Primulina eburnea]|uniref:uncharacterized protein n=1 Tax=Primulina eburnea TaxID=1245227 RepID=UPI003C6C32A8